MKFRIDENLPVDAAELLRLAGYDATTVIKEYLGGEKDVRIAASYQRIRRIWSKNDTATAFIKRSVSLSEQTDHSLN